MIKPRNIQRYGWKPSFPDPRDVKFQVTAPIFLPPSIDLRSGCPPIYDQGQVGSCTGNAWAAAYEFGLIKENKVCWPPSRLFIYFGERSYEGTTGSDSGAMLRDGAKTLNKLGVCNESTWQYDVSKVTTQPSSPSFVEALKNTITEYQSLSNDILVLKQCLASGIPFIFGFTVFDSFESNEVAQTGNMPMPDINNESILGGHAVLGVGYDDSIQCFIIRNSWGIGWGQKGYFTMPYAYITNPQYASDFWCIKLV